MTLKKPSDLFRKNNEENNNIPVVETDNSLREELTKVESLSEQLSQLQQELTQKVVQTDLEKLVLSQINTMQENFAILQEEFQQSNERDISKFRETVVQLGDIVGNLVENEIPKYKKQITSTDVRISQKFNEFKEVVEDNIDDIREDVETKVENIASAIDDNLEYFNQQLQETSSGVKKTVDTYNKLSKIVESRIEKENGQLEEYSKIIQSLHDVKADVVIAEQHIKNVDKYLKENHQELIELKEEVFAEIEKLPLGDVQENVRKLERKLEYIEGVYKNIEPEVIVKEVIQEGLLNEPPDTKNSDPLTPLDQNFVTLDQLQQHYRLFINRIQQQLATIGGGGETRLEFLDDVDRDSVKQDGYVLQYDATVGKFIGTSYVPGGSGAGGTSYWVGTNAGIYTTGNVAIGTDVVGSGSTALWVEGDARITGILSVGQGTITLNGNTDTITVPNLNVGVGGTIITTTGIGSVGIGSTQPGSTLTVSAPSGYTGNLLDLNTQDGAPLKITNPQKGQFNIETYDTAGSFSPTLSFRFGPNGNLTNSGIGIWNNGSASVVIGYGIGQNPYTSGYIALDGNTTKVKSLGFNDIATLGSDLKLERDAANTLAQRNGTNAQTSRIYNTYTTATNFERANVGWTTDVFIVGTEKGVDGGTARQLELQTDGTTRVAITTDGYVGIGTTQPDATLVVNAPSGYTGNILDLQRDGTSKTYVDKDGRVFARPAAYNLPAFNVIGIGGLGSNGSALRLWYNTTSRMFGLEFDGAYSFNNQVKFYTDTNILEQRIGTNAQTSRIYNTYTSSTNFERAQVGWTTNTFIVGTEKGSAGGSPRQLELQTDGTTRVAITTDGYVGIGSTQPTATLDVNGDVNITGVVTATKFVGEVEIINPFLLMGA